MVTADGVLKVLDFGLAKLRDQVIEQPAGELGRQPHPGGEDRRHGGLHVPGAGGGQGGRAGVRRLRAGHHPLPARHRAAAVLRRDDDLDDLIDPQGGAQARSPRSTARCRGTSGGSSAAASRRTRSGAMRRPAGLRNELEFLQAGAGRPGAPGGPGRIRHPVPFASRCVPRWRALVLMTAVALAGWLWTASAERRTTGAPGARVSQQTFYAGVESEPSLSPDGQFLAYAAATGQRIERHFSPAGGRPQPDQPYRGLRDVRRPAGVLARRDADRLPLGPRRWRPVRDGRHGGGDPPAHRRRL